MFLANYYNLTANSFMTGNYRGADNVLGYDGNSITGSTIAGVSGVNSLSTAMSTYCKTTKEVAQTFQNSNQVSNLYGVIFGDGSDAPALSDYQMSGEHLTGYTVTSAETIDATGDSIVVSRTYTITNTLSTDFTIREIGLSGYCNKSSGTAHRLPILLERTLLDEPVTIPAGGIGLVTYTIRYNVPTT